jgi:peptidyl-prolyl cis-trans isomerase SurA
VRSGEPVEVDRIVAVVGEEVITRNELDARISSAVSQLRRQNIELPPEDVLERQMLERMITDRVQLITAKETGLQIPDNQLDQAIARIAASNKLTVADFRRLLEKDGVAFSRFREEIRGEMLISQIRERDVDSKVSVSEGEIDNYLAQVAREGERFEYAVSHILLRSPEGTTPEQLEKLRQKGEQILAKLKKGEDFAQVAAAYSDAPDGLRGGDLGFRPLDEMPTLFAETVDKMKPGEVSPLLRSANGFHIIKLREKRGGEAMPQVQQTHARHILVRVNELLSERDAKQKLVVLRERLEHGADFADLARQHSQDGSAPKGGDLGWLYAGDTVPEFEKAMDELKPNQISEPIRSPFGWHLIQVLERRVQDVSADRRRQAARAAIRSRKADEAYQDWLRQQRDRVYVEIRLQDPNQ